MFGIDPIDGWIRAGKYLNINSVRLDINKIFDSINREKPDLLIIEEKYKSDCLQAAIKKFKINVCEINEYLPACDCPPNFEGGKYDNRYKCDALVVGHYDKSFDKYINILDNSKVNYKIFGSGLWQNPHYLGLIKPTEISNAYKTAKYTLDLEGNIFTILAILAAKGNPLSIKKWNSNIECVDITPQIIEDNLIENISKTPVNYTDKIPTLADRLQELLGNLK